MMRIILAVLLILPVAACGRGSPWQAPPARESLIPEIRSDGTKFFIFQRDYLRPDDPAQPFIPSAGPGSGSAATRRPSAIRIGEFDVEQRIAAVMLATGYCRRGFFELYREQTFQSFSVRGECREEASDEDLAQFQQTIPLNY